MNEPIRVVIKQESQGDAIARTEAQIKQLQQAAANYDRKGMGGAAQSARSEAASLEKALEKDLALIVRQRATTEKATAAERLSVERAITRERMRQSAEAKLESAQFRSGLGRGLTGAVSAAGGGLGPIAGMAGMGPQMLAVAAAMATIGKLAGDAVARVDAVAASEGKGAESANRRARIKEKKGIEGQELAAKEKLENKQNLDGALDRTGTFRDSGIGDMLTKGVNFAKNKGLLGGPISGALARRFMPDLETSSIKRERENQLEIDRLQREKPEVDAAAAKAFTEGPGGQELRISELRAEGHRKEARAIEYKMMAEKEWWRVHDAGGEDWQANQSAGLKIAEEKRKSSAAYANMIDARSGAGDTARMAGLAREARTGSDSPVVSELRTLRDQLANNHSQALNHKPFKNFVR